MSVTRRVAIINSARPEAIGDCVSAFPAIRAYSDQAPIEVFFSCAGVRTLLSYRTNITVLDSQEGCEVFDIQQLAVPAERAGLHMVQAWYQALGLGIPDMGAKDFGVIFQRWNGVMTRDPLEDILVAPFSSSDNGTGAKVWPDERWQELLLALTESGHKRRVSLVSSAEDPWPPWFVECCTAAIRGQTLDRVCGSIAGCKLIITVDNGISWLAQAVGAPHILLQPSNHSTTWSNDLNALTAVNIPDIRNATPAMVLEAVEVLKSRGY